VRGGRGEGTANIQRPTSNGQRPTSNGERPTANGEHPTSNIQRPTSNVQHPTANGQRRTSNGQRPTANGERRTSNGQRPTSNGEHPTANGQRPTSNGEHPTSNGERRTANVQHTEYGLQVRNGPSRALKQRLGNHAIAQLSWWYGITPTTNVVGQTFLSGDNRQARMPAPPRSHPPQFGRSPEFYPASSRPRVTCPRRPRARGGRGEGSLHEGLPCRSARSRPRSRSPGGRPGAGPG